MEVALSITSLIVGIVSIILALYSIFNSSKTHKEVKNLLFKIEEIVIQEEEKQKSRLGEMKKLINGDGNFSK